MSRASPGRADAGRTGGRHLRRRGPVRIARADHAGGSGAAHHAAGGRDARAAPDAGQSGPTVRPPTTTRSWARASPSPACCTRSTWWRTRNCPSCCWARPAWARNCSRTACRLSRRRAAAGARELRRPARVAGRERAVRPRQGRVLGAVADRPGRFEPPTAAPCSWTKSANCRCWCRPSCCARCRTARSSAWATTVPGAWTCASWPPPTAA